MYLAYTYFIRNKITNQFHYGSRYKNVRLKLHPKEDLWIKYFTSSKAVKDLISEYGEDSFECFIIFQSSDFNECYWHEQRMIEENISHPLCLNEHYTREGKVKFLRAGVILEQETKDKMSIAKKDIPHSNEHNLNVSKALKLKYNTPILPKIKKRNRKSATKDTKNLMSASNLLRPKITCPHCSKIADPGNYARYHGDKCTNK